MNFGFATLRPRNLAIIIVALLVMGACSGDKQSFTLSGKIKGLDQGEFVCFSEAPEWGTLDTIHIQGGKFSITHPLADTVVLTLQYPNFMQTQVIAIPGEEVTLTGNANNMLAIEVGSDDENEALNDFRNSLIDLDGNQRTVAAEQFIMEHPASWASIAVFQKYFLQAERPDYAKMAKLLDEMGKNSPDRKILQSFREQLRPLLSCRMGNRLPSFKATTLKGETVTNATFKGKPLLITFWSNMAPEFSYPIVSQRHLMRRLSGRLALLNICLDVDTADCRRILRRDTIGGYNVCDLGTFDSPLVRTFGLRKLPANIFVDSIGVIRERDIAVGDLEKTLAKYGLR